METLLQQHLEGLRRYLDQHAGDLVGAKESSSDLVQSVCREVLERLATDRLHYQGEAEFRSWLYGAALLKVKKRRRYYRSARRDVAREQPLAGQEGESLRVPFRRSPSSVVAAREEVRLLRAALQRLPDRYRKIVEMAQWEGLSHGAIARRLEISEAHSRVLLARALARLATIVSGRVEGPNPRPRRKDER